MTIQPQYQMMPSDASLILAHQLIAAKLNLAAGVDGSSIANTVAEADRLLDAFNNSGH